MRARNTSSSRRPLSAGWLATISAIVPNLGSLVGFVTLFGIATRNAVMLISHYDHLVTVEGETWGRATASRGALERLGPILMTALVTALGLLPLALGSGDPGREIEGPMAIVFSADSSAPPCSASSSSRPWRFGRFGRFTSRAGSEASSEA